MKHTTYEIPAVTPSPKQMVPVQFNIGDLQYLQHGAGCIAQAAKKIAKGDVVTFECFKTVKTDTSGAVKYQLYQTLNVGISKVDGKKAVRMSTGKDLSGASSESLIASWNGEVIVCDAAHIATELVYCFTAYGYNYVREQPKK